MNYHQVGVGSPKPTSKPVLDWLVQLLEDAKKLNDLKSEFGRLPQSPLKEQALSFIEDFFETGDGSTNDESPSREYSDKVLADALRMLWKHNPVLRGLLCLNIQDTLIASNPNYQMFKDDSSF